MRFEELKPEDYKRIREQTPIAYVPWGAHEWHGKHNALGLDTLKAHGQCMELCAETGGVVFPEVYCGTDTMKTGSGFDCTLNFSPEVVGMLVREYMEQLADEGFKVIIILMGHYGGKHVKLIEDAAEEFNAAHKGAAVWAVPDWVPTADDGFPGEHAAVFETSYLMYFRPELVDLSRLPQTGDLDPAVEGIHGGDPREASRSKGRAGVRSLVQNMAPRILELLNKQN